MKALVGANRKLLVIDSALPDSLAAALSRQGVELIHADWPTGSNFPEEIAGCFVWFYQGMRSPWKVWRLSCTLRSRGIPLIAWNRDAPHYLNRPKWRLDWYDRVKLLDIYATHSLHDPRRFADTWLYFPNAADTERYNLGDVDLAQLRDPARYRYDVSFFGAMDGARYKELQDRQNFLMALGRRLVEHGISFEFRESDRMSIREQVSFIQESRINLNYGASCEFGSTTPSGLPERCYGIQACGGFLLSDRRIHAQDDFMPGINWSDFTNLEDCVAKIRYWIASFDLQRDLAERAYNHVLAEHTYDHRAQQLLKAIDAWRNGARGRLT